MNNIVDLRDIKPPEKKLAVQRVEPPKERVIQIQHSAEPDLSPQNLQRVKQIVKQDETTNDQGIPWPTPNPDAPLLPMDKRLLYYLNQHGKRMVISEMYAYQHHNKMREFHGDQFGNMTPPRKFNTFYKKGRGEYQYKNT